ncbi:hypothetical protein PoB_006814700 [Plakobranchus ocellatus]|uniref:Mutator-like transposase domain-containing protein n=1 Tax=Plakobranchus ocellatus TaxID=259542 RepID=A0AAV4DBK7_9GAST|nr:hypothetical protein PoB_006814700 [Plakobranchus ocellatus]
MRYSVSAAKPPYNQPLCEQCENLRLKVSVSASAVSAPFSTDCPASHNIHSTILHCVLSVRHLQLCHVKERDWSFAVFLELRCSLCEKTINQSYTSRPTAKDQAMETNQRAVLTGLTVGLGHAGLMKVAEGLGMSSMHETITGRSLMPSMLMEL